MRISTVEYVGEQFHGFVFGNAKLAVARLADRKVKILIGPEARLAIDVMHLATDTWVCDTVMDSLAGAFMRAKGTKIALSADAKALALSN